MTRTTTAWRQETAWFKSFAMTGLAWMIGLLSTSQTLCADDWPQWGGPQRDLVWRETGIVERLPAGKQLPRVWSTPIAEGYSGPAVADGRVFITDYLRQQRSERFLHGSQVL